MVCSLFVVRELGNFSSLLVCSLFVVRELGNFSSLASLVGKGIRRQVAEC